MTDKKDYKYFNCCIKYHLYDVLCLGSLNNWLLVIWTLNDVVTSLQNAGLLSVSINMCMYVLDTYVIL